MSRATVCRVCLASDVIMHHIRNTQVQEIFEKFTSKKLTDNGRPETICYLCYSHLQKCCKFLNLFNKTENVFEQLLCGGIEITQDTISFLKRSNILNLITTPIRHIDLPINGFSVTAVESFQNVTIKEEPIEVKVEPIELSRDDVIEGTLYVTGCTESDDSTKDSTWHFENYQKLQSKSSKKREKKIQNTEKSKKHIKTDSNIPCSSVVNTYTCEICNKTFEQKRGLQQHSRLHNNCELYTCSECNKAFTIKANLHRHCENVHNKRKHKCDECDKTFTRSDHLKNHYRSHSGEKPYPCNICKITFKSTYNVQQHIRSIHFKEKPFSCDKCKKSFSRKGNLQVHYRVHTGKKPYNCDKCDYQSSLFQTLKWHISKMHSDSD